MTVGGANGDLYKALQTLPGTQVQGETGELLVRGGSNYETQTFMDGMHVLNPYTSNGIHTPARSRYSTFMFSGVNLASGGASQEYGEALSAALPLETKDYSPLDKLGVNVSVVGVGGGGTKAFDDDSLSVDLNYQNLGLYDKLYSGRREFEKPYRMCSLLGKQEGHCSRFGNEHPLSEERVRQGGRQGGTRFQRPFLLCGSFCHIGEEGGV